MPVNLASACGHRMVPAAGLKTSRPTTLRYGALQFRLANGSYLGLYRPYQVEGRQVECAAKAITGTTLAPITADFDVICMIFASSERFLPSAVLANGRNRST